MSSDRELETISLSDVHATEEEEAHKKDREEEEGEVTVNLYHGSSPAGVVVEIDGSIETLDDRGSMFSWFCKWACCKCRSRTRSGSHRLINEDSKKGIMSGESESSMGHSLGAAFSRNSKAGKHPGPT